MAVPAFPGAEGFGANSVGGRGGDVYHVTTLAADPDHLIPGSLCYGLYVKNVPGSGTVPGIGRTIVFDVGGTIDCSAGTITFKDIHNVTIAGQTAPGPGITILGDIFGITGNSSTKPTHNIVVRYITARRGSGGSSEHDAMHVQGSANTHDIILDHMSGSWSLDEVISVTQTATNVTIQNSIMSEALTSNHAYGALIRPDVSSHVSYVRNLFSNQKSRNPRPGTYDGMTLDFEFQNNVIYNWSDRAGYIAADDASSQIAFTQHLNMNYVGNYLIAGPSTVDSGSNTRRSIAFYKEVNAASLDIHTYQAGNKIDSNDSVANHTRDGVDTGWNMFKTISGATVTPFPAADQAASRFAYPMDQPDSADIAYAKAIAGVGNTPWARNETDKRLINNVLDYTGAAPITAPPTSEWNNLMSQPMVSRAAGFDTDQDGMPNSWESLRGTNPAAADNNGTLVGNGYTNLENYLNSLTFVATWNEDTNASWSGITNWRGTRPNSNYSTANFSSAATAPRTVTVDIPVTVSDMLFDNANSYTLSGPGTITFDALSGFATVGANSGTHAISAPVTLADNLVVTASAGSALSFTGTVTAAGKSISKLGAGTAQFENIRAAGLSISGGVVKISPKPAPNSAAGTSVMTTLSLPSGTLDLTNNALVIEYTTLGTLLNDVRQAIGAGALTTSIGGHALGYATASVLGRTDFAGVSVDSTSLLVAYTFAGDSNLDGTVNGLDFNALATNLGAASGKTWTQGDFNYDGFVNSLDFNQIAANFNQSLGASPAPLAMLVPEPSAAIGVGLFIGAARRGRRR